MHQPARQTLLILGMHRSGTSAVAGAAALLGAQLPKHLISAAADNPAGFFESPTVIAANEWILSKAGCAWYDCLDFSPARLSPIELGMANEMISYTLSTEFSDAGLILLKDPRLCVVQDIWLPALQALAAAPSALIVLRHPAEVTASLQQRDGCPVSLAVALWLSHMLSAERATRGHPRSFLAYEALLQDWRSTLWRAGRQTGVIWPKSLELVAPQMQQFLDANLRHHRQPQQISGVRLLDRLADETYRTMLGLTVEPEQTEQLRRLGDLRAVFERWVFGEGQEFRRKIREARPLIQPVIAQPASG